MFLSALALAVTLQAVPEISLKGYLVAPSVVGRATQSVGELILPLPRKAADPTPARRFRTASPSVFKAKPRPPARFLSNPHIAGCNAAPQFAANPQTLTLQPLSKMPKAHGERAVSRLIDGCAVAVPIQPGPTER